MILCIAHIEFTKFAMEFKKIQILAFQAAYTIPGILMKLFSLEYFIRKTTFKELE